jgi:hypothetical protein
MIARRDRAWIYADASSLARGAPLTAPRREGCLRPPFSTLQNPEGPGLAPVIEDRSSYTILVHNGVMKVAEKAVRQSVSLPPRLAKQVGSMAKSRKLSKNRMLLELIENGIDAEKRKQQQFLALAERFRNEKDPEAASRLGDELGRMVFGG